MESLNFQISVAIYLFASFILMLVLIGFFMMIAVGIASFVLVILATIKANEGKFFRYPFTIRLVK